EDGIRDPLVTGVQTCALPIFNAWWTEGGAVDARPGGTMVFRFVDWGADKINAEFKGRVLEARRPERFVYQWGIENPDETTTVERSEERRVGKECGSGGRVCGE